MKLTESTVAKMIRDYLKGFIVPEISGTIYSLNDISALVYRETFSELIPALRKGKTIEQVFTNFKGDGGHGHSPFQIDDRWHPEFIRSGDWKDLSKATKKCIDVLEEAREVLSKYSGRKNFKKMIFSAYNSGATRVKMAVSQGKDPDHYTFSKNYGAEVMRLSKVLDNYPDDPVQAESKDGQDHISNKEAKKGERIK